MTKSSVDETKSLLCCFEILEMVKNFESTKKEKIHILGTVICTMIDILYEKPKKRRQAAQLIADGIVRTIDVTAEGNSYEQ